ncbi:hypothetical protein PVAND_002783 [Polypedilum vanderplanki]|uniref:Proactivator polypeptide n=1 Tax=Polypedilum vanderplanki TaxID=319348 RepID=A0A9J6BSI7_POLVA|nr:hypothetical protein PVAND_002783 [Polypedilum vanderplanki]
MWKLNYFIVLLCVVSSSSSLANNVSQKYDAECSKGITFWCEHLMNAKKCNAVDFCIKTVWENHLVKIDSNPLCDDCKDWVKQARDLLERKETANAIIRTLAWSCALCPDTNGRTKCRQIISNNVMEILKLLDSRMNPDAICSAIHFCNNREFTKIFEKAFELESQQKLQQKPRQKLLPFTCGQCNHIGSVLGEKLANANHDDMLEGVLKVCGQMSSFSDACSNLVFKNFNDIYQQLPKLITKEKLCHSSCSQHYQNHEGIVDISPAFDNPNIPCELCEQLMLHLREVLIANTTEIEFKNILEGFCNQMPSIAQECVSLADQYYDSIYQYLVNGLDANKTCVMIGICSHKLDSYNAPAMPLLSSEFFPVPEVDSIEVHIVTQDSSINLHKDGRLCTACEYTMNLVHIEMNKNGVQENILKKVRAECKKLPAYVRQCEDLIDTFGDQIMNAIYQGTNPRLVCPLIKMCPPNLNFQYLQETAVDEKPTCPFCLFAMQEVRDLVSSNASKTNVEKVLDQLCTHLSDKLKSQCIEFVNEYSSEVVDMILANFTPQEACVFIKLCSQEKPKLKRFSMAGIFNENHSDEMIDFDDDDNNNSKLLDNPQCDLCKAVIKLIEQRVIDIKSKDEIRRELENSCSHLKRFSKECKAFVDKYSDRIVDLVSKELAPENVCKELIFCVTEEKVDMQDYDVGLDIFAKSFSESAEVSEDLEVTGTSCIICEFIMTKIDEELNDKQKDEDIKHIIKNVCSKMPSTVSKQCNQFIDYYFDMIIVLIETTKPSEMCKELKLCPKSNEELENQLVEIKGDIYTCAVCRGAVESLDSIIEDPQVDVKLENLEEKICEKFAGKFKEKCHNLTNTYGTLIINLLKNIAESDQICYKLNLCASDEKNNTGMARFY